MKSTTYGICTCSQFEKHAICKNTGGDTQNYANVMSGVGVNRCAMAIMIII